MAASNILAGFVRGATGVSLDNMEQRRQAQAEAKKAEMLERLRRETAMELAAFEESLPSSKLAREKTRTDMRLDEKAADLNERKEQRAIKESAFDQQLDLAQLDVSRRNAANSERYTSAITAQMKRKSLDNSNKSEAGHTILNTEFSRVMDMMKSTGANEFEMSRALAAWYEGVNQKGWSESTQRTYINTLIDEYSKKVDALTKAGLMPSQLPKD